jgi:hypothetical protein
MATPNRVTGKDGSLGAVLKETNRFTNKPDLISVVRAPENIFGKPLREKGCAHSFQAPTLIGCLIVKEHRAG